ncbi:hypothetical protein BH09VER1_BH09VER1_21580 [soil metagenome]
MNRPLAALAVITLCFVAWLGSTWLPQPPSSQELLANYSKVADYFRGLQSVHGWVWWTPSYMEGASTANVFATMFTNAVLQLFSVLGGMFVGPKLAGLFFLSLSPFTMYLFVSRLNPHRWAACAAGVFYLISPSILLRLGFVEHISIVSSLACLPLAFWGVLVFLESPSLYHALACAVAGALLSLAYAKIAILSFPILLAFAVWAWIARAKLRLPPARLIVTCLIAYIFLAVLCNLPAIREGHLVARFQYAPFESWQHAFSTHSVISWLDLSGLLSGDSVSPGGRGHDSSFVGLPVALLLLGVLLFRRQILHDEESASCRIFLALALFAQWFAFGPNCALLGQWEYLKTAAMAPHPSIALSWLLLAFQVWLIFFLVPQSLPWRLWIGAGVSFIYLVIPGFQILQRLPLFADVRAPYDIFLTSGIFCVTVAGGLACSVLWRSLTSGPTRAAILAALIVATGFGAFLYTKDFRSSPLDAKTFDDFLAAQKYLSSQKNAGRVLSFSGRYFYLLTPILSQRGLITEAFNSYYMLKEIDTLQKTGLAAPRFLLPFLNFAGVSYVLIDRMDPDTPEELQNQYRSRLPVAFENAHFLLFENKNSLAPAFLASNYASTSDLIQNSTDELRINTAAAATELGRRNIALIQSPSDHSPRYPDASVVAGKITDLPDNKEGKPFAIVAETAPRLSNYQRISLGPSPEEGWVIVPEAYHPDWVASAGGKPVETRRAMTAFLAAWAPANSPDLTFEFHPPVWYDFCATAGLFSWIVALLGFLSLPLLPSAWRKSLFALPVLPSAPLARAEDRPVILRPIVILPTYNESLSINNILNITLSVDAQLDILVVDDNSPDGTASLIRNHPGFGQRIHLLERAGKLGLGSAYKEGFQWALERGFDACIEMDADLSHNPEDIPRLLTALNEGADAAIGSRYLKGVRVMNWPEERLLLSSFATKYVRALTRLPLTDSTSGFKAVRANALRDLDWRRFRAEGYGFQIELHYHLWQQGWKLVEVPIVFTERGEGNTKMTRAIAVEAAFSVLRLALDKRFRAGSRRS